MTAEDSQHSKGATTKVCTTSRFGERPLENQGFQRHEALKIDVFVVQSAKSG